MIFNRRRDAVLCPLCGADARPYRVVDHVDYHDCDACDFIFADPALLVKVDAGEPLRSYDETYWRNELSAARDRSYGSSLARVAEAALYSRLPIERFIDIGTGPGYLLDALSVYLPSHSQAFYGVEKFPPGVDECTSHPNYLRADLGEIGSTFQCGVCIEVIEHLTPVMARALAGSLAEVSEPGSLFLFNTGLTQYVRDEDPAYLDPYGRGHITCWSTKAAARVFEPFGFSVHAVRGKSWAFVVERAAEGVGQALPLQDRIWSAPEQNKALLRDPHMGEVMYLLGLESARAY